MKMLPKPILVSLRGRRLKEKGTGVLGKRVLRARETRFAFRVSRFAFRVSPFPFPLKRLPCRLILVYLVCVLTGFPDLMHSWANW